MKKVYVKDPHGGDNQFLKVLCLNSDLEDVNALESMLVAEKKCSKREIAAIEASQETNSSSKSTDCVPNLLVA